MVGLILAIIIFNFLAFKTNKQLKKQEIAHIWMFTIAFQVLFDVFIDLQYHGYWYFTDGIDWAAILPHTVLIPPVNMMFINWYPDKGTVNKKIQYFVYWVLIIVVYELATLAPQPWGYFNYGWWKLEYSVVLDPILLYVLFVYYKNFIKM